MVNRFEMNEALKSRLLGAENAEQAADILKKAGQAATPEDIAHLWDEIGSYRKDKALSLDELESVSGGADRDWLTDGCAATVEAGSWCGSNDSCYEWDVTYDHYPVKNLCPICGINLYLDHVKRHHHPGEGDDTYFYRCNKCGHVEIV